MSNVKKSYDGYRIQQACWDDLVGIYLRPACHDDENFDELKNAIINGKCNLFNIYDKDLKHVASTVLAGVHEDEVPYLWSVATGGKIGGGIFAILKDFFEEIGSYGEYAHIKAYIKNKALGKKAEEIGARMMGFDEDEQAYVYIKDVP